MKKNKIRMIILLGILLCIPTIYRLNAFENGLLVIRGTVIDFVLNLVTISTIDVANIINLILSALSIAFYIAMCCSYQHNKKFIALCYSTLVSVGLSVIWSFILAMQMRGFMSSAGLIANIISLLSFVIVLTVFVVDRIKRFPRRATKAERLQAQIDELQKQVEELKKGE